MNISRHSIKKIEDTLVHWRVDKDFSDPVVNYLVHGFDPGGFFTSVLANDFIMAVNRSHSANTIPALKCLAGWMTNHVPAEARGSYEAVRHWLSLSEDERRAVLEYHDLIYTPRQETWLNIKEPA